MNNFRILLALIAVLYTTSSCMENSEKYRTMQAKLDSLTVVTTAQNKKIEAAFATLNEVESGLKSIREAENILAIRSESGGSEILEASRDQLRSDISTIGEAIKNYRSQIDRLKKENRLKSSQFTKRLNAIIKELNEKSELIATLHKQIEEKDAQLIIKSEKIESLDKTVSTLKEDITFLREQTRIQQEQIEDQEKQINSGYYTIGTKSELIDAKIISKGGLFKASSISYLSEKESFVQIDIRNTKEINTNSKDAKVLSIHPAGTYAIEKNKEGLDILKINKPNEFWEQTKYLVIQVK